MLSDLPSADAAKDLIKGVPGALPRVAGYTALRAGLIGAGLLLAGQRKGVTRGAVVASLAIEIFVLTWAYYE
jgi:hypothetical protein